MLLHLAYAVALIFGTTFIHAGCTVAVLGWLRSFTKPNRALRGNVTRGAVLGALVFVMSLAAFLESALWAGFYRMVDALPTLGDAFYFSLVTFTTLGYGDITLDAEWRLLAAFEAANGIIMFGWTTALIVAVANRLFLHHEPGETRS